MRRDKPGRPRSRSPSKVVQAANIWSLGSHNAESSPDQLVGCCCEAVSLQPRAQTSVSLQPASLTARQPAPLPAVKSYPYASLESTKQTMESLEKALKRCVSLPVGQMWDIPALLKFLASKPKLLARAFKPAIRELLPEAKFKVRKRLNAIKPKAPPPKRVC